MENKIYFTFLENFFKGETVRVVYPGDQTRCFTYIDDGLDCLMKIIEDNEGAHIGNIFNIGNPDGELSIRELAVKLRDIFIKHPLNKNLQHFSEIVDVEPENFYGEGYQDITHRVPSIQKAKEFFGWEPRIDVDTALTKTLDYHLNKKSITS